jgi:RimJ/RimL family protein N-acetyltransferase/ketosteroid isomerase-like protein
MQIFLETERLVLRRFTADDVDNLVELDGDPEVMQFITGGRPTPREEIENEFLPAFLGYYERFAGYGFWAAVEKSSGRFLGWFHFRPPPGAEDDEVELGYRLHKSAWGQGYATEGSRALIEKGFAEHGVRRVVASTMVVNVGSRRVMEKSGLKLVRTFHQPWPDYIEGEEKGDVEYALIRSEWEVLALFAALYRLACGERDADAAIALWAPDEDIALFGSEEGEACVGPAAVHAQLVAIAAAAAGLSFAWEEQQVHVEGDAAWVNASGTLTVDGRRSPYRVTGVFVRREGGWRWHTHSGSEPTPG